MKDDSAETLFQSLLQVASHWQGCPFIDLALPAFPLPITASPALQGALKDGSGEAVVVSDMPEPRQFPSLEYCQKRFLWTHEELRIVRLYDPESPFLSVLSRHY